MKSGNEEPGLDEGQPILSAVHVKIHAPAETGEAGREGEAMTPGMALQQHRNGIFTAEEFPEDLKEQRFEGQPLLGFSLDSLKRKAIGSWAGGINWNSNGLCNVYTKGLAAMLAGFAIFLVADISVVDTPSLIKTSFILPISERFLPSSSPFPSPSPSSSPPDPAINNKRTPQAPAFPSPPLPAFSSPPPRGNLQPTPSARLSPTPPSATEAALPSLNPLQNMLIEHYSDDLKVAVNRPSLSRECDIYDGKWIYDTNYPLWDPLACPFDEFGFNCRKHGRPDSKYTNFRWQPHGCKLPRFNASDFRELMRNRRLVFVGDSLGRNQFESMLCMTASGSNLSNIYEMSGSNVTKHVGELRFMFKEYNFTIEYYRSPWLVALTRKPKTAPPEVKAVLQVDTIDWVYKEKVNSADVFVFNNGHWWNSGKTIQSGIYFQVRGKVKMNMTVQEGYRTTMVAWASWLDKVLIKNKAARAFFRGYSPVHFKGGLWNTGGRCDSELPNWNMTVKPGPSASEKENRKILALMRSRVTFMNIEHLTQARGDAHIGKMGKLNGHDCSHWCLPGVPDIWNELLYAELLISDRPPFDARAE